MDGFKGLKNSPRQIVIGLEHFLTMTTINFILKISDF